MPTSVSRGLLRAWDLGGLGGCGSGGGSRGGGLLLLLLCHWYHLLSCLGLEWSDRAGVGSFSLHLQSMLRQHRVLQPAEKGAVARWADAVRQLVEDVVGEVGTGCPC